MAARRIRHLPSPRILRAGLLPGSPVPSETPATALHPCGSGIPSSSLSRIVTSEASDIWSRWLTHGRHGGDPEQRRRVLEALGPVRDRVLENARISAGDTLLDVGTGELHVYVGGTVTAGDPQLPGTYSAVVTLQATYTGN